MVKRGNIVHWSDGDSTDSYGEWEESNGPPSPFDRGDEHNDLFGPRYVPLDGARVKKKVRKQSHSSSDNTTSYGSGDNETGSSSKEITSPSASPVSDGSGGGEEAGLKTVNGKEPEEQESYTEVENQLWCRVGKHIKGCTCPCSPHEHTPNCKCFETADGLDKMMEEWGPSQKHWARELIREGKHLEDSDDEP